MVSALGETTLVQAVPEVTLEQLRLRHPEESEYTLLRRLLASGTSVSPDVRAEVMRQQREAVLAATGMAKGIYEVDYLAHVRGRWAS